MLTSDSTRIVGLVSLADVANGDLRTVATDDAVGVLERLDDRIDRNERIRLPLTIALAVIAVLAAVLAPRHAPRVFLVALAANLWLAGWWLVALLAVAALVAPLGLACLAVLVAYLAVLGLDPEAVALSPFGPSQAGRFYGVSNLLATMLLVPALIGAARLGRLGIAVAAIALVLVGGNHFGADGGGLLVLLAGYGVLILRQRGTRVTARLLVALGAVVVLLGLALVALDSALGFSSHVTHTVGDGPLAVLEAIGDRLELSARRTFSAWAPALVVLAGLVDARGRRDPPSARGRDRRAPRRARRLAHRQRLPGGRRRGRSGRRNRGVALGDRLPEQTSGRPGYTQRDAPFDHSPGRTACGRRARRGRAAPGARRSTRRPRPWSARCRPRRPVAPTISPRFR